MFPQIGDNLEIRNVSSDIWSLWWVLLDEEEVVVAIESVKKHPETRRITRLVVIPIPKE